MPNEPAIFDFKVNRRSTVPLEITFKTDGVPVNISGYVFAGSVFNKERTQNFADFDVTVVNSSQGKLLFKLTPTQTEGFTLNELEYDIKYKQPNNDEFYLLEGTIFVSEGYTVIS
tara:strand:+ start:45 stop:389 length:345 start_codon:yes stop_codon:yes gene_type:complete